MKIELKEATVTSNLPQENVTDMSISTDGMEHIMSLLTNLYKDPELAVIREYYTNAVDAHVASGNKAQVLVTLPTWDTPNYTVQDFGIGMSKDDIQNIYAKYGASTKRKTNDQVGAFGLGCKSALTIATQFTLVSIKDGWKTTVLISKTESGINTVNVVSSVETDEENGTTVRIPVPGAVYGFNGKAHEFFSFSTPGTVLVDGQEPTDALEGARKVVDPNDASRVMYLKPRKEGTSYIIMGNVPYALSHDETEQSLKRIGVDATRGFVRMPKYFPVAIGSVDLTPSREGLRFTDKTNAVIDSYMSFILTDLKQIAKDEINATTTIDTFFESYDDWKEITNIPREWNGEEVPISLELGKIARTINRTSWGSNQHMEGHGITISPKTGYNTHGTSILVKGFAADQYKKINAYIGNYMTAKGLSTGRFVITDDPELFTNKWVLMNDRFTIVDGNDIIEIGREQRKKERLEAAKAGLASSKKTITYPVFFVDDNEIRWVPSKEIEAGTPYIALGDVAGSTAEVIRRTYRSMRDRKPDASMSLHVKQLTDAKKVILLNNARTTKALGERVKNTYSLADDVKKVAESAKDLITDDVIRHHAIRSSAWKRFVVSSGLDQVVDKIRDTRVKEIIEPTPDAVAAYAKYESIQRALNYIFFHGLGVRLEMDDTKIDQVTEELDKKYPLILALNSYSIGGAKDHLVKYLNMVHAESELDSVTV